MKTDLRIKMKKKYVCPNISLYLIVLFFCILTYATIYILIHDIIFWLYLYFFNIIYFFKYSCTNILHRRSVCTFYFYEQGATVGKKTVIKQRWNSQQIYKI